MATATPAKLPDGGGSIAGDEEERTRARYVRQLSDRELRYKAQRLHRLWFEGPVPRASWLPDRGKKMRLFLRAVLDEINRRRQHGSNGATRRAPDEDGRRAELHHVAQQRHGPVNEATTTALPERRQSSGEVNAGAKRVREATRQSSDSEQALWERVQHLQELFAGPDGCRRLRLFLETCFREVSNRERRRARVHLHEQKGSSGGGGEP